MSSEPTTSRASSTMTTPSRPADASSRRRTTVAVTAAGLLVAILAGCGEDGGHASRVPTQQATVPVTPRPAGIGGSPAASQPAPNTVARTNPDAVAQAALIALYSYDTTIDNGPNDTAHRALPWLSARFAAAVTQDRPVASAGATWTEWTTHHAYITPDVQPGTDDRPPDSATTAVRQFEIILAPTGRDGWKGQPETRSVFVTLTKEPLEVSTWAVDQVQEG